MFETVVYLRAKGKERPRAGRNGFYTPRKTKLNENIIKTNCRLRVKKKSEKIPLKATLVFEYASAGWKGDKPKKTKPDLDNCIKLVLDAMNDIVYDDDNLICEINAKKIWGKEDKISIKIEQIKTAESL